MDPVTPWFQVFVPGYNCETFLKRCLDSIAEQDYPYFSVTMVDDASTDGTGVIMDDYAKAGGLGWTVIHNETNQKMPWNLHVYAREGGALDVIFIVDADDFLPRAGVLTTMAEHFSSLDTWLTYGSYTRVPDPNFMPNPAMDYPPDVKAHRSYRAFRSTYFNHPLAFRRFLWNKVEEWELKTNEGEWFRGGYDVIIMMPMLEMAGTHWKFLPDILYVYNEENPLSDARVRPEECSKAHDQVLARAVRASLG